MWAPRLVGAASRFHAANQNDTVFAPRGRRFAAPTGQGVCSARLEGGGIATAMKRLLQRCALLVLASWLPSWASAHAVLDSAVPAARSTVRTSPKELTLKFS